MAKIKDTIEVKKEMADKELEAVEPGYRFSSGKHVHTIDGKPLIGTSTVGSVLMKVLTWWASGLAVEKLGWKNSKTCTADERINSATEALVKIACMTPSEYLALLDEAYKAHSVKLKDSAAAGTDLHAELERFVKDHMAGTTGEYDEKIKPFIDWTLLNVDKFIWSEVHCYSKTLWVGGISDVGVLLKDGRTGIIDFKSSKEAYESHFYQCAGYDLQLSENGGFSADGKQLFTLDKPLDFYAVVPFGAPKFSVEFRYNTDELKEIFKACLMIYKYQNK